MPRYVSVEYRQWSHANDGAFDFMSFHENGQNIHSVRYQVVRLGRGAPFQSRHPIPADYTEYRRNPTAFAVG